MDPATAPEPLSELLADRTRLHALLRALVRDERIRDDVEQETWLRGLGPRPLVACRDRFAAVARGIAANLRRADGRRRRRESLAVASDADVEADPARIAQRLELERAATAALLALDEPCREALLLRFFAGLDAETIARRRGEPAATIRSRQRRGLELLRERLDREREPATWRALLAPLPAATRAAGVLGTGAILMKWKAIAAAALLAVAAGTWLLPHLHAPPAAPPPGEGLATRAPVVAADAQDDEDVARAPADPAASEPAPVAAAPTGSIHGRVMQEESRRPLAGATVASGDAKAITAADGTYRLEPLACDRTLVVLVEAQGILGYRTTLTLPDAGDHEVDLRVPERVPLKGRVVDAETGAPIAGASVTVTENRRDTPEPPKTKLTTDGAGAFELAVPRAAIDDHVLAISAMAAGYASVRALAIQGEPTLPLPRGCSVEGVAVYADGRPVAANSIDLINAVFDASRLPAAIAWPSNCEVWAPSTHVKTDSAGRFHIDGVAPATKFALVAWVNSGTGGTAECTSGAPGSSQEARIVVESAGPESVGIVEGVLSFNGKPGPLPFTLTSDRMGTPGAKVPPAAGPDGRYRCEGVGAGRVIVTVRVPGIAGRAEQFTLRAGETRRFDVDVRQEMSWIGGRVTHPDGAPAAGIPLTIRAKVGDWRVGLVTDADGAFRQFAGAAKDDVLIVRVNRGAAVYDVEVKAGDEAVAIALPRSAKVRLRAIDAATNGPLQSPALRLCDGDTPAEIMPGQFRRLPGDVVEVELLEGAHVIEVDRAATFFRPTRVAVSATAGAVGADVVVVVEAPSVGFVRLVDAAPGETAPDIPMPLVFWREAGETGPFRALSTLAYIGGGREFTLPAGRIELGFGGIRDRAPTVVLPAIECGGSDATLIRVHRKKQ